MPHFFFKKNIFTVNELASLYHLPDGLYNQSPIIKWMDYKALAAPNAAPKLKDPNGFYITGVIAEGYKKGKLADILKESRNPAVGEKIEEIKKLLPISDFTSEQLKKKTIIKQDGEKFVEEVKKIKIPAFKVYKDGILL